MLKVELLRNERERVVEGLKKRNWTSSDISIIDQIIELDDERKGVQTTLDIELAEQNQLARQIGELMKIKNLEEAETLKQRVAQLKDSSKTKEDLLKTIRQSLDDKLITLPN
ncbi:MAG TPA: serine--tRNA ligase, partial [Saprospiraceae bacterium]|nr:serine--tRNA ligase [Saprospiraceae bacterium]